MMHVFQPNLSPISTLEEVQSPERSMGSKISNTILLKVETLIDVEHFRTLSNQKWANSDVEQQKSSDISWMNLFAGNRVAANSMPLDYITPAIVNGKIPMELGKYEL